MSERWDITGVDNRILEQYRDSPNLLALLRALIDDPNGELRAAFEALLTRLDIDASVGIQLDLIGTIIGRPRPTVLDPILVQGEGFFEFRDTQDPNNPDLGFDSLRTVDPLVRRFEGAPFGGITELPAMTDPDYRELLKAVIFLNTSGASVPELEFYGQFVLGATVTIVNGFTEIDLEFAKRLTIQERAIIEATLLPAAGIRIRALKEVDTDDGAFSMAGNIRGTGFGEIGEEQVGAGFVRIV